MELNSWLVVGQTIGHSINSSCASNTGTFWMAKQIGAPRKRLSTNTTEWANEWEKIGGGGWDSVWETDAEQEEETWKRKAVEGWLVSNLGWGGGGGACSCKMTDRHLTVCCQSCLWGRLHLPFPLLLTEQAANKRAPWHQHQTLMRHNASLKNHNNRGTRLLHWPGVSSHDIQTV